ncbi:hypothetical protein FRC02_008591, partial [Tulasnella sp. 418]
MFNKCDDGLGVLGSRSGTQATLRRTVGLITCLQGFPIGDQHLNHGGTLSRGE